MLSRRSEMSHFPELIFSAPVIKTTITISVISLDDSSLYFTSILECIYFNDSPSFSLQQFHIESLGILGFDKNPVPI